MNLGIVLMGIGVSFLINSNLYINVFLTYITIRSSMSLDNLSYNFSYKKTIDEFLNTDSVELLLSEERIKR